MSRAMAKETKPKPYLQRNQQPNSKKIYQTNKYNRKEQRKSKNTRPKPDLQTNQTTKTSKILQTNNYRRNQQSCSRINKTQRTNLNNETAKTPNKQTPIGEMSRAVANILGPARSPNKSKQQNNKN